MKTRIILFILLLSNHLCINGQDMDSLKTTKIMERIDFLYDSLSDIEKKNYPWNNVLLAQRHHFIRVALQDIQLYDHLSNIYSEDILSFVISLFGESYQNLPFDNSVKGTGSSHLFYNMKKLLSDLDSLDRMPSTVARERNITVDDVKLSINRLRPLAEMHRYPDSCSFLAAKDRSLANSFWSACDGEFSFLNDMAIEEGSDLLNEKQRLLGSHHPCYALTLSDLALLYSNEVSRDYTKAIALQKQALDIYRSLDCVDVVRLAAKHLSHIYHLQYVHTLRKTYSDYMHLAQCAREEISIIEPILGKNYPETVMAYHELKMLEDTLGLVVPPKICLQIDSVYRLLPKEEKNRLQRMRNNCHLALLSENDHHYVRSSIVERQLLNDISEIFGNDICDTLAYYYQRGNYIIDSTQIANILDEVFKCSFYDNSRMGVRLDDCLSDSYKQHHWAGKLSKQFRVSDAQSVVDIHQYPRKFAHLSLKDDSLVFLIQRQRYSQAQDLADRLLSEKRHSIDRRHPTYALTLSDMALLCLRIADSGEIDTKERDEYYAKALSLQTEATNIYSKSHHLPCKKLSAQFLSHIWYSRLKMDRDELDSKDAMTVDSIAKLKQRELSITQPLLGDSAWEVIAVKAELRKLMNHQEDLYVRRHEDYEGNTFQKAVGLFNQRKYREALQVFTSIRKNEHYKYLPVRGNYTAQWMAACHLHLGDTIQARAIDPYYLLGPINRSKTLELDYLCTYEPDNPQILIIARDSLGASSSQFVRMLLQASELLIQNGNMNRAVGFLMQAKRLFHEFFSDQEAVYAQFLDVLGNLYNSTRFYKEAVLSFGESLAMRSLVNDKHSVSYQSTLDHLLEACNNANDELALCQWRQEKLQTDTTLTDSVRCILMEDIAETLVNKNPGDTASVLKAVDYLNQSISLRQQHFMRDYPHPIGQYNENSLFNYIYARHYVDKPRPRLAYCYHLLDRTDEMFHQEKECVDWLLELKNMRYGNGCSLHNLFDFYTYRAILSRLTVQYYTMASCLLNSSRYDYISELLEKAKFYRKEDKSIRLLTNENHPLFDSQDYVIDVYSGVTLQKLGRHEESVRILQKTMRLREELEGRKTKYYYLPIRFLASSLNHLGRKKEAADMILELWNTKSREHLCSLAVMNGQQRESYWDQNKALFEKHIPSLSLQNAEPVICGMLYDNVLLCKGLLLNTEMEIDRLLTQERDTVQSDLYRKIHRDQLLLMGELEKPLKSRTIDTDSLRAVLRTQEHSLTSMLQQSKSADIIRGLRKSWVDIEKQLRKKDLAVEFLTSPQGGDTLMYAALTLRKGYDHPHLIPLFNNIELNALQPTDYYQSSQLYDMLWKPLADELDGVENVYFSPVSSLHHIGIEYLPEMEKFNVYRLSSTRELLYRKAEKKKDAEAVLYGGLKFELTKKERENIYSLNTASQTTKTYRDTPDLNAMRELRGAVRHMPVLEGSLQEVHDIDSLMRDKRVKVSTVMGTEGTEESFKALSGQHKSIIHISTHGFYQQIQKDVKSDSNLSDLFGSGDQAQTQEDRSLSRSGLLMTGAADHINGVFDDTDSEDGVLTAKEISRIDLHGLDLVVLSACETGLGDVSGEGVFGLQRGFKKAGANTMLVSLWKVEDDATQLLMTEFYRNLLSGKTKRRSFQEAQQALRCAKGGRFNRWECWASFVMIDAIR